MTAGRLAGAAALLMSAAALSGCGAGTSTTGQPAAVEPSASSPAAPSSASAPAAPSAPAPPAVRVLDVRFAGGSVTGVDPRVPVALGEQLVIRVSSDVADEVHVHGYDLYGQVAAGGTVQIPLTADIPGGFEVELEGLGKTLFQLRVA